MSCSNGGYGAPISGGGLKKKSKQTKKRSINCKGKNSKKAACKSKSKSKSKRKSKRAVRFHSVVDLGNDVKYLNNIQKDIINNNENNPNTPLNTMRTIRKTLGKFAKSIKI